MTGVTACRGCGCTDDRACPGGCAWVDDPSGEGELCSACLIRIWNREPLPLTRWTDEHGEPAGAGATIDRAMDLLEVSR